ncbi:MAG: CoA transferase [Thermodesulfobacteriota bacterium]|nr:CoA transferase [Thermodesulfobacteriota bacterium]
MTQSDTDLLFSPYRALDLTDEKGLLCGRILADLGADVIKVERPGGDSARNIGPFYNDIPDPEKSLFWFAYNTNKRGITLNIESLDGQDIFKKLLKTADFVIESFDPSYMDSLGLGYSALSEINPRVIMASITPYGQTGPYRNYKACDLTLQASGGLMYGSGDPDRPPVRISFPQAYFHASVHAASATLIAHHLTQITGEGQHVDVSAQESTWLCIALESYFWPLLQYIQKRGGGVVRRGANYFREVWICKDGEVNFRFLGGAYGRALNNLVTWMEEEGMAGDLAGINYETLDIYKITQEEVDHLEKMIGDFFAGKTKAELQQGAIERHIYLQASNTPEDIVKDEQLASRDFWASIEHPELDVTLTYPGLPFRLSETHPIKRAPLIGEHNIEVYKEELGLSAEKICALKQANII